MKPPGKVPLIIGTVLLVLYFVLTFQASAAYDTSCVHGTLHCGSGTSATYVMAGFCLIAGLCFLAWAAVQRIRYRRFKRQPRP